MIKITIEETRNVPGETREWKQLSNKEDGTPLYGYVKDQWYTPKTVTLLEQELEQIDLVSIIKAINKII